MNNSNSISPEMKKLYNRIIIGSIVLVASVSYYNNITKDEVVQKEVKTQTSEYDEAYFENVWTDNAVRRVKRAGFNCDTLENSIPRSGKDVTLACNGFQDMYRVKVVNGKVEIKHN